MANETTRFTLFRATMLASLLVAAARPAAIAQDARITFLHVNDIYVMESKDGSGLAPLMTLIERERARAPGRVLTTFGGDLISPSLFSSLTRGAHMIRLMNAIGVQAAVPGNHEFDFGSNVLGERLRQSAFPWLAANLRSRDGAALAGFEDGRLITLGGIHIGLFGVLAPETRTISKPGAGVRFGAPITSAKRAIADLRSRGAEIVVALTHLHLKDDLALARAAPGIDLILGGHDHYPVAIERAGTLIVKAGQDARHLAVVDLDVHREPGGQSAKTEVRPVEWRFLATRGVQPDPDIAALIARIQTRFDGALNERIGVTETAIDGRRSTVRRSESTFGNLIADAMREATDAEVALINGGGIRGNRLIAAGSPLTRRDVMEALPFDDVAVVLELDGTTLRAVLEHGVARANELDGRFLQVSGLRFSWHRVTPPGAQVRSVTIGDAPLDPFRTYRVAAGAFIANGGDGYAMLKSASRIIGREDGLKIASLVIDHVQRLRVIAPRLEGRILEEQ